MLQSIQNTDTVPILGTIILKDKGWGNFEIIDGQQRLTTITILAKALYDSLPEEKKTPDNGIFTSIIAYLFYNKNASDSLNERKPKITHSYYDKESYSSVVKSTIIDEPAINLSKATPHN